MKKYISILIVLSLLIALLIPFYSYGVNEKTDFFTLEKDEVSNTDTLEMIINIEQIQYDKFKFQLVSSSGIKDIKVNKEDELDFNKGENEILIQIDKNNTNLSEITLTYKIPSNINLGDKITLTATVTNLEKEEEKQTIEKKVTIVENIQNKDEKTDEKTDDNQQNSEQDSKNEIENVERTQGNQSAEKQSEINTQQEETKLSNTQVRTSAVTVTSINTQKNTVTYNGSANNYLSELYVEGYQLNKEFLKECETYFITVNNDVQSIDVVSKTEDENASICVYGNENLQEGKNKVLISVTAENGNVRNYRIYVTKNN